MPGGMRAQRGGKDGEVWGTMGGGGGADRSAGARLLGRNVGCEGLVSVPSCEDIAQGGNRCGGCVVIGVARHISVLVPNRRVYGYRSDCMGIVVSS